MNPNNLSLTSDSVFKDFLIKLEENAKPETILKLQLRIEELENQLSNQTKAFQKRELELHKQFDQKKSQWIVKYYELKLQLENQKKLSQTIQQNFDQDFIHLYQTIHQLVEKLKKKDEDHLVNLKQLEKEISSSMSTVANSPKTNEFDQVFSSDSVVVEESAARPSHHHRQRSEIILNTKAMKKEALEPIPNNFFQLKNIKGIDLNDPELQGYAKSFVTTENNENSCFIDLQSVISPDFDLKDKENNFVTPKILRQGNNNANKNIRNRNMNLPGNKESTLHTRFSSTLQSIPPMAAPLIENIHKKVTLMIADLTNSVATIQFTFSQEVEDILKRVETIIINSQNSQDSSNISNNNNQASKKSKKAKHIAGQENISKIYKILENNIAVKSPTQPPTTQPSNPTEDLNRSSIIMQKMWVPNPNESTLMNQRIQDDVLKVIEEIQGSLTVADREAILCTLINAKENNKQFNELRFDDFGSPRSKFSNSMMSSITSPSLSIKYPADKFGQSFRSSFDYSAAVGYEDPLPKDPKSRQIIANHLAQQRSQFQQSMDIADARKYQDSYYQRDYFRNDKPSYQSSQVEEQSIYSMSHPYAEGSVLRDFRERVQIENISPIKNATNLLEKSLMSTRNFPRITKEDFLDKGVNKELVFSDVNPYSISKENYSGITGGQMDAMGLPERLEALQVEDFKGYFAKQAEAGGEDMNHLSERLKGKNNLEFCFKVCGSTKNKK